MKKADLGINSVLLGLLFKFRQITTRENQQQSNGDGGRVVLLMVLFNHDLEVFSAAQLTVTSVHESSEGL